MVGRNSRPFIQWLEDLPGGLHAYLRRRQGIRLLLERDGCVVLGRVSVWDPSYTETSISPCVLSINETWKGSLDLVPVTPYDENYYETGGSVTVAANGVTCTATNIRFEHHGCAGLGATRIFRGGLGKLLFRFQDLSKAPDKRVWPVGRAAVDMQHHR